MVEPRVVSGLLLLGLAACGPDLPPPLAHLEPLELPLICGQPGPFRVLALDEDQTPTRRDGGIYRFEDRLYFVVGKARTSEGITFDPWVVGMETTLYSTGLCGESPSIIATDIWEVLEDPRWPGLLLATTNDGDLVVIDPHSGAEPRLLIEEAYPRRQWTEHGMIGVDEERGALSLWPYPSSPTDAGLEPTVLVEPFPSDGRWGSRGDEVFFVEDGTLHRLDLLDGSRAIELDRNGNIGGFSLPGDGRFIVWETREDGDGFRSVAIFDRLMGIEASLGQTDTWIIDRDDHIVLEPRDLFAPSNRFVMLPSMEQVDAPPSLALVDTIDDTRLLAWRAPESWLVYDRTTNTTEPLFDGAGEFWHYEDRMEVLVPEGFASGLARQGPVYAAWFDGRRSERIVDQATPGLHHLSDGRIVTPLHVHDRALGTLALTGLDGVTRWELDTEAVAWFDRCQAAADLGDDVIVYGVSDGDRSGVWLAHLPPAE